MKSVLRTGEFHPWWVKSLGDEIRLAADEDGFDFTMKRSLMISP